MFLAVSTTADFALASVLSPFLARSRGPTDLDFEVLVCVQDVLEASVYSAVVVAWLGLSRSRHWRGKVRSVGKILTCQMDLCSWRLEIIKAVASVSDLNAASRGDANDPRGVSVLPLKLAAQAAVATGVPSLSLGHTPWHKRSAFKWRSDASHAMFRAWSFQSSPRGMSKSVVSRSDVVALRLHGPCLNFVWWDQDGEVREWSSGPFENENKYECNGTCHMLEILL